MFWRLTDFVKSLGRKATFGAVCLASYFLSLQQAKAQQPADIIIDSTWTFQEINNVMDGDPLTKGHNNISDPAPWSGDIIEFAGDTEYVTLPDSNSSFRNYIPGIKVRCEDNLTTILKNDPNFLDGIVFINYAPGFQLLNCKLADGAFGFVNESADPSNPVIVQGNVFQDIPEKGIIQSKVEVIGTNTSATLKSYDNLFDGVGTAMSGPRGPPYYGIQQPWIEARGNTAVGVTRRLFVPPVVISGNTASIQCAFGMNDFVLNVYDDSNGILIEDTIINAPDCVALLQGNTTAGTTSGPKQNLEGVVGTAPQQGDAYAGSLNHFYPNNGNTDNTDPHITCFLRPMANSPLIGEQYLNPDGSPRGVRGAKWVFGDWDGDTKVNEVDENKFLIALNKQYNGQPLTAREKDTFYVNCDGPVDVEEFYKIFVGVPQIPAVSTWGVVVLALGSLIAGTVVLTRRRDDLSPRSRVVL